MQTLQSLFTNRFVVSSLIALSLFVTALVAVPMLATAQEAPIEEIVPAETVTLECDPGQVLNEAGDACVDEVPTEPEPVPEQAQRNSNNNNGNEQITYCHVPPGNEGNPQTLTTSINAYENAGHANHELDYLGECLPEDNDEPQDDPYEDTEEDGVCLVVSDTLTYEGGVPSVLVSDPHDAWTAVLDELSKWIWGEDPTALTAGDEVETFTRTFSVDGEPTGAMLEIAADNGYSVSINGNPVCADSTEYNYNAGGQDECIIPAESLLVGENTIEFVVTNKEQSGETPASNPGGLRYVLTVNGADCGEPVENSCALPSSEGATDEVEIGDAPGSEDELQEILDDEGYSLDALLDQVNTQKWTNSGDTVNFTVANTAKNAAYNHVFGYYLNGGAFVPVFKNGAVAGPLSGTPDLAIGSDVSFSLTNVNDVVFGIAQDWNGSSYTYYATDKTMNPSGDDHTVVYNPENDTYVIAFEDLPLSGDHDYNDIVVTLTVDGCEKPDDTATVVATKIVCSDESYLPNWGNNGPNVTSDTAADFLADVNEGQNEPVCWLESGWQFQWAPPGTGNPGDNVGVAGEPWTLSGLTAVDGTVEITVPAAEGQTWFREVMQEGYVPFSADTSDPYDDVSAEMYCETDVLHYDNWDWINNVEEGETYHCIAINALPEPEYVCNPEQNLLVNGDFEANNITDDADWDIFEDGDALLAWSVDFLDSGAPAIGELEHQKEGLNGWLANGDGDQWVELDSDWGGPSSNQTGEKGSVSISQEVATEPGQVYMFEFDFSARPGTAANQNAVSAYADGVLLGTVGLTSTAGSQTEWETYSFSFTATDDMTLLELRDAGTPNDSLGTFVDNVDAYCVAEDTTTLTVNKVVVGNDQYTAEDFTLYVNGETDSFGVTHNVYPGSYDVSENGNPFFVASFSGACVADEEANATKSAAIQDWLAKIAALEAAINEPGDEAGDIARADLIVDIQQKIAALQAAIQATVTVEAGDDAVCTITNTYTTPEPQELTECFDGISNDEDGLTDEEDPGCHTDGDPNDVDDVPSYDPNDNDEDNGGDNEPTGTLIIIKTTNEGANGSFDFVIDPNNETSEDEINDVLTTVDSYASESYELAPGSYSVDELYEEGWVLNNVNCTGIESGNSGWGSSEGGGGYAYFTLNEGDEITCHFHNVGQEDNDNEEEYGECGDRQDNDDDGESDYEDDDCHTDGDASDDDKTFDPNRDEDGDENGGTTSGGRSNRSSGSVLGASTQCNLLITEFMRMGAANNSEQVMRLQEFLNQEMLSGLPVSGLFGPLTEAAVKAFQIKYADKVLAPWVGIPGSGIDHATDATGYVYMSTAWMINEIVCPEGNPFFPDLTQETNAPAQ
jgi:hypothetical protein